MELAHSTILRTTICYAPHVKYFLDVRCPTYASAEVTAKAAGKCTDITPWLLDEVNGQANFEAFKVAHDLAEVLPPPGEDPKDRAYLDWQILRAWREAAGVILYVIEPPVVQSCSDASKWRNRNCIDPTVASEIYLNGSTELDWTPFYYSLTSSGVDPAAPWTISDTLVPYNILCDEVESGVPDDSDSDCTKRTFEPDGSFKSLTRMEPTWTKLTEAVEVARGSGAISIQKENRFDQMGLRHGVTNARVP